MSLYTPKIFVSFSGWLVAGAEWGASNWFFKSLDNNMVYSSGIYIFIGIHVHKRNPWRQKVIWVLKFGEVRTSKLKIQNRKIHVIFIFWYQLVP